MSISVFTLLGSFFFFTTIVSEVSAQKVYTRLTDKIDVQKFNRVSNGLICQCGCNFVLSSCPHVECPFAIPVRRFIENRIREKKSAEEILEKIETGFGESILKDPQVMKLIPEGRSDLIRGFVKGFGPSISAHTSPLILILIFIVFTTLAFLLFLIWKKKTISIEPDDNDQAEQSKANQKKKSTELENALERIKNLDR